MGRKAVQDAIQDTFLEDGEIVVGWALTIEVARADGQGYLAHRSGGGVDGANPPNIWSDLGMTEARVSTLRDQLRKMTGPAEPYDD